MHYHATQIGGPPVHLRCFHRTTQAIIPFPANWTSSPDVTLSIQTDGTCYATFTEAGYKYINANYIHPETGKAEMLQFMFFVNAVDHVYYPPEQYLGAVGYVHDIFPIPPAPQSPPL